MLLSHLLEASICSVHRFSAATTATDLKSHVRMVLILHSKETKGTVICGLYIGIKILVADHTALQARSGGGIAKLSCRDQFWFLGDFQERARGLWAETEPLLVIIVK